jgi:hypothetical protein
MANKGHYSAGKKSGLASSLTNVGYGAGQKGTLPGGGKPQNSAGMNSGTKRTGDSKGCSPMGGKKGC